MLTTDSNVKRYTIVASITEYTFNFPFWDMSEISVTVSNTSTGASETLEKDVDYTLTVAESIAATVFNGGTVTMISDKYKSYNALVIMRSVPFEQETHIPNSEPINGEVLEMTLDKMVAQSQQLNEDIGHALKLPETDAPGDYRIPEASQRQRKVLGFDTDGKTIVMFSNPDDAIQQSSQILEDVTTLKGQAEDAKEAAEEAQGKAEDAQAAAEQAKADTQEIADEAETTIGNSNTTGLRGDAVTAIQTALENALASIGESNSEGARGDAIEAITAALNAALASIGQSDAQGARGAAITAIAESLTAALQSISATAESANEVIDQKVEEATEQANTATSKAGEAADSAELAEKWASNPEDTPVTGEGDTAKYSSYHWAQKAMDAANSPLASESSAGRIRATSNASYVRPDGMTEPVAYTVEAVNSIKTALQTSINTLEGKFAFVDSSYEAVITPDTEQTA